MITQAPTIALPATTRPLSLPARAISSANGTAIVATMSATVTCAITASAAGPVRERSCSTGSTTVAEPEATSTAYTAGCPAPPIWASSTPALTATAATIAAALAPVPIEATSPGSRSGMLIPAANISIAKPISARNDNVGLPGSIASMPVLPNAMPASSSPTTTGAIPCPAAASSGPAKPQRPISASVPKLIRLHPGRFRGLRPHRSG